MNPPSIVIEGSKADKIVKSSNDRGENLSQYLIRKELLEKFGKRCHECFRRRKVERLKAIKVNGHKDSHQVSDYILVCDSCRMRKRKERERKRKANRLWICKPSKRDGSSEATFFRRIRPKVFERDGEECQYCGETDREKLALAPITPRCKGGKLALENYVVACHSCRTSKLNDFPLDFFWRDAMWDMLDELEDVPRVSSPDGRARIPLAYLAECNQFLYWLSINKNLSREVRNKAERIHIKMAETDGHREGERKEFDRFLDSLDQRT